jgi:membrane protein YdbS with pleckstrin-like domain
MPEIRDDAGRFEPGEGVVPGPDAEPETSTTQGADAASAPVFASDVAAAAAAAASPGAPVPAVPSALEPPAAPAAPKDSGWLRVSPKYVVVEVVGSLIGMVVFVGGLLVAYALWGMWWALWGAIVIGVISLVGIALEPRRVRSIGYRLREDDLVFKRGIMFQRQVAVPYGRMQLVDITRGPVARALGLADLKFVTAAAATAVTVPGLPMEEADRLRDELVALAETRRAGL